MKILKYQKLKNNEYKIITEKEDITLYDDIIIKYELLLKKDIDEKKLEEIKKENNLLKAYYVALKEISKKMRCESEIKEILSKKNYNNNEITYAISRLNKDGYLNHQIYIEAFIHDMLALYLMGENKIKGDLIKLGFKETEIMPYLEQVDKDIYLNKIKKYIDKKAKVNKKSINEFKRKTLNELINKGFYKEDIMNYLDKIKLEENNTEIEKLVLKEYHKYIKKYDLYTTKTKIKSYLYSKGYSNINIDEIIENNIN